MIEQDVTAKAVVVEVRKLDLGPDSILAITVPENWNAKQLKVFESYLREVMNKDDKLREVRFLMFPFGMEFTVIQDVFAK